MTTESIERLRMEIMEVETRLEQLRLYTLNSKFMLLSQEDRRVFRDQEFYMVNYLGCLQRRFTSGLTT